MPKEKEKQQKQERADASLFRHTGNGRQQKKRLKQLDKEAADIEEKFNAMGGSVGGKKLSQMSDEELEQEKIRLLKLLKEIQND